MAKSTFTLLITIIFIDVLVGMEFDIFVPSFAQLQQQLNLSPFFVESLLSINFIGYCLSLFLVGQFSDRYGRKPIILLGLGIFIVGSLFCLQASSYWSLLIGRFFQGLGIAGPAILSFLIIADEYPLQKQQFLMTLLNGSMNTATSIAPIVGSYITLYFHWQGNFSALLGLGVFTFLMTFFFIPSHLKIKPTENSTSESYFSLFRSKHLLLLIVFFILLYTPYWIFVGISPLLYIKNLGVSLSYFGYYQGVFALVFAIGSVLFSLIIHRYSQKKMLYGSLYILISSLITVLFVTFFYHSNPIWITLSFLPFVIGEIIPSSILYPICINLIPHAKARISATIQGGYLVFSAMSLQLVGYFYAGNFFNVGIIISFFIGIIIMLLFLYLKKDYYLVA